nr:hypothetical protein [uncultured Flavobacterium sp.]
MRKLNSKLVLILVLSLTTNFVFAQTTKVEISPIKGEKEKTQKPRTLIAVYDFQTGIYTTDKLKPKHNQPIVLKIINVNKFANLVEITNNDVKISNHLEPDEVEAKTALENNKLSEAIVTKKLEVEIKTPDRVIKKADSLARKQKKTDITKNLESLEKHKNELLTEITKQQTALKENNKSLAIAGNQIDIDSKKSLAIDEQQKNYDILKQKNIDIISTIDSLDYERIKNQNELER